MMNDGGKLTDCDDRTRVFHKPGDDPAGGTEFPRERHRWNTNEEICGILSAFDQHCHWLCTEVRQCPPSGSMLLYTRSKVKNHSKDGYWWKKRKDGKTTREDHMKLKVKGVECIYGKYSHSAILPTFHRRCYWLLQNPDIVLVHYLNVYTEDTRISRLSPQSWPNHNKQNPSTLTRDDLTEQLRPMFHSEFAEKDPTRAQLLTDQRVLTVTNQLLGVNDRKHNHKHDDCASCQDNNKLTPVSIATRQIPIATNGTMTTNGATMATSAGMNLPVLVNLGQLQSIVLGSGQSIGGLQILGSIQQLPSANQVNRTIHHQPPSANPVNQTIHHQPPPSLNNTLNGQQQTTGLTGSVLNNTPKLQTLSPNGNPNFQNSSPQFSPGSPSRFDNEGLVPREERVLISPTREVRESRSDVMRSRGLSPTVQRCASSALVDQYPSVTSQTQQSSYYQSLHSQHFLNSDLNQQQRQQQNTSYPESQHTSYPESQHTSYPESHHTNYPESQHTSYPESQHTNYPESPHTNYQESQHTNYPESQHTNYPESRHFPEPNDNLGLDSFDFLDLDLDHLVSGNETLFDVKHDSESGTAKCEHCNTSVACQNCNSNSMTLATTNLTSPCVTSTLTSVTSLSVGTSSESSAVTKITDYSPEWAYPEGGSKLLVTGPWYSSNATYTLVFDGERVSAELVQNGVLRCVCPAHAPGTINFQVACDGQVISNSCQFEYKNRNQAPKSEHKLDEQTQWLTADDKLFKLSMLERMADIEKNLFQGHDTGLDRPFQMPKIISHSGSSDVFEDCMVAYCEACSKLKWLNGTHIHTATSTTSHKGMTLLHLASALGYVQLIRTLMSWRENKPSGVLEYEVDALSLDDNSCTPFFWACALNKVNVAVLLFEFNPSALNVCTRDGTLPMTVAKFKGHVEVVRKIEELTQHRRRASTPKYTARVGGDKLRKRLSMELFPQCGSSGARSSSHVTQTNTLRNVSSQPLLTSLDSDLSGLNFDTCDVFMAEAPLELGGLELKAQAMDTDDVTSSCVFSCESPIIDVEKVSSDDDETPTGNQTSQTDDSSSSSSSQNQMVTLAKQIIAAMPERIKLSPSRSDDSGIVRDRSSSYGSRSSVASVSTTPPCSVDDSALAIETFSDYRYSELSTPASSLSPASSSCLHSPLSFTLDSPPPTTSEFQEYFNAPQTYMEKDFSQLTLSDQEQRRLYEAAKIIQNFYRRYKDRYKQQLQRKQNEIEAAILIQSYYRRYKEYAYYKKMCQAAVLIQSQFRSYQVQKRYKRSRDAATIIQNQYRAYKEYERFKKSRDAAKIIQQRFRSHYQRSNSQDQARQVVHPLCRQSSHGSEKESGTNKDDKTANEQKETEPEREESTDKSTNPGEDATSRDDQPQPISSDDSS